MSTAKTGLAGIFTTLAERRQAAEQRKQIERELAGFVTEADRAELSAILERNSEELGLPIHELISDRVLAGAIRAA